MARGEGIRSLFAALSLALLLIPATHCIAGDEVARCIDRVSATFGIDALPLELLREVEGGQAGTVRRNRDGSEDLGPMQVNSVHLPMLAAFGITREDLRDNRGCRNVLAATLLYLRHLRASRGDPARAIARYHSATPRHARRYLMRIQAAIQRRQGMASRP